MTARRVTASALRCVGLALLLATPLGAQSKVVGWGPTRLDSSWNEETFVEAEAGVFATLARRADGTLASPGLYGADHMAVPALPPGVSIVDVSMGGLCVALLSNGTAITWPDGVTLAFSSPVVQVAAGLGHCIVLLADGSLRGWGPNNTHGQATPPPGSNYVEVAAGFAQSLARRSDGTIVAFGQWPMNVAPPPGLAFVQMTAGLYHGAALLSDGTAFTWGVANQQGQLDAPPPPVGLTYVELDAGPVHTIARLSDGTLTGWGSNAAGQLDAPPLPAGMTYVDVSAGGSGGSLPGPLSMSVALRSDGRVIAFGWNGHGQLNAPAPPAAAEHVELSVSGVAPDLGGALTYSHIAARHSDGSVVVFGDNTFGQALVPPLPAGLTYVDVDAGGLHTLARRSDGSLVGWGDNSVGQLNGMPAGTGFVALAAGTYHSLALRDDGTITGWGSAPLLQVPVLPPGVRYVEIDAGQSHSIALRSDGEVVAWGVGSFGQLDVPALPPGVTYVSIAAGGYHSLARRSDGNVVAWGHDFHGQLKVPPLPAGVTYVEISAASRYSAALRSDGVLQAWGDVELGQLDVPALAPGERLVGLQAGASGLVTRVEPAWSFYGTGKLNSLGCIPTLRASGMPSASQASGFLVECELVQNQVLGILVYTVHGIPGQTPFQCGTLLVGPGGVQRAVPLSAGGNPSPPADCSGVLSLDMNAFAAGAAGGFPQPALQQPGTVVHAQWWGRDGGLPPPCASMLSNAIEYSVGL